MKDREFKFNLAVPDDKIVSITLLRMKGYLRTLDSTYKPTAKGSALKRRNSRRLAQGKTTWRR